MHAVLNDCGESSAQLMGSVQLSASKAGGFSQVVLKSLSQNPVHFAESNEGLPVPFYAGHKLPLNCSN
jgi:hypothetical protein